MVNIRDDILFLKYNGLGIKSFIDEINKLNSKTIYLMVENKRIVYFDKVVYYNNPNGNKKEDLVEDINIITEYNNRYTFYNFQKYIHYNYNNDYYLYRTLMLERYNVTDINKLAHEFKYLLYFN